MLEHVWQQNKLKQSANQLNYDCSVKKDFFILITF